MLQPTDQITVTLTATEWNQVLAQLAEGPFRIVAPLLGKIQQQATAQGGAAVPDGALQPDAKLAHSA